MVVREGLGLFSGVHMFNMCTRNTRGLHTAMHNSIVHTENGFQGVPVAVAHRGKRSDQDTTMFSGTSARSNTERRMYGPIYVGRVSKNQDSEKHRSNIDIHARVACRCHLRFISNSFSTLCNLLNLHLADPKVDDSSRALLKFVRSFTANKINGTRHQPLLHAIRNIFVFVLVGPASSIVLIYIYSCIQNPMLTDSLTRSRAKYIVCGDVREHN